MDAKPRAKIVKQEVHAYPEQSRHEVQMSWTFLSDEDKRRKGTMTAEGDSRFNNIIGKDILW
jgi:hypothetical protein